MKKIISYSITVLFIVSGFAPVFAFAENATSTPVMQGSTVTPGSGEVRMYKERNNRVYPNDFGATKLREKAEGFRGGTATSTPAFLNEMRKKQEERRNEMQKKQEERKNELQKRQTEMKKKRDEQVRRAIKQMVERFQAAIRREQKLADRIDSRLNKAAANGKDVSALRVKLADASAKLADAKSALDVAVAQLQSAASSATPKDIMKSAETAIAGVKEKIKAAHAALVDVINSLKGIGNTATSTPVHSE